jgi:hypothetical protein
VDLISVIRQMMAESNLYEAQKTAEMNLSTNSSISREHILPLYLEILALQHKKLPEDMVIEAAEIVLGHDLKESIRWLEKLDRKTRPQNYLRIQLLKIRIAESKGRLGELYALTTELRTYLHAKQVPAKLEKLHELELKYFKNDFQLKLKGLALTLTLGDVNKAEIETRDLIYSCVEKASPKGTSEKLLAIAEVINVQNKKCQLEMYQNYCRLSANGFKEKSDYKKIIEIIIYFDDFRFQVLILDLLFKMNLGDFLVEYIQEIRSHSSYDFVYIEKYFGHLKKYFVPIAKKMDQDEEDMDVLVSEYELERPIAPTELDMILPEPLNEDEILIISSLKFHDYSAEQLIELAVSFLQSRFFKAASEAATRAMENGSNNEYLKACYLKAISLFNLTDYRAVLDLSLNAISRSERQDDILSFLYLQAEAYSKIGLIKEARISLLKILAIDGEYRLSRKRLESLDEI